MFLLSLALAMLVLNKLLRKFARRQALASAAFQKAGLFCTITTELRSQSLIHWLGAYGFFLFLCHL